MHWISEGIFTCNKPYFERQWQPAESDDKSIPTLIAKGTLIDTESKDYQNMAGLRNALAEHAPSKDEPSKAATHKPDPVWHPLENSVFDSEESAQSHPDFKDFDHIVINQKNPSNRHLHLMRMLLREKGYRIYEPDAPSDEKMMVDSLKFLGYSVYDERQVIQMQDIHYEIGYAKGLAEGRRQVSDSNVFATRAYQVGFDAGRMVERLGILKGEENDREERESASEGDPRVGREGESRTVRWSSGRGGPSQSIRRTESRSRSATQWADSEQPIHADERRPAGEEVPETHGDSPAERNENEKGDA